MTLRFEELRQQAGERWRNLTQGKEPWIRVGTAICGDAAGAQEVIRALTDELQRRNIQATVSSVGCLGLCYAEPLVDIMVPGGPRVFYGNVTPDAVPRIIESHLVDERPGPAPALALAYEGEELVQGVPRLQELPMMRPQLRIALRNAGNIDTADIHQYIANDGYVGLDKALTNMEPQQILEEVQTSGLRGRGGAAFPTGTKWSFLQRASESQKFILCNCEEGDPGAFNDKAILESDPYTVLEGMTLAGYATGAPRGFVFIRHGHQGPIQRTQRAIQQAYGVGLLGQNILGTKFSFDIEVALTGESYVSGEETALMEAIEGKRAMPRFRPPFPAGVGVWGLPSNINNVKTLAYVPEIISRGGEWFASIGHERSKGTAILCLSGDVKYPGMAEVPMGLNLRDILYQVAGGPANGRPFRMLQTGGPLGGVLHADDTDIILDFEAMAEAGAMLGSGGIIVADESACAVDMTRLLVAFCQFESCGKCFPCRLGTTHMLEIMERITRFQARPGDLALLQSVGQAMATSSLCGHGQLGYNPVQSALRYFAEDFRLHIEEKRCPTGRCLEPTLAPTRTRPP